MIPSEIRREHIEAAMDELDHTGIPPERLSRKFYVLRNEKRYPPKYVISIASRMAGSTELKPRQFHGGAETNKFLQRLGYKIEVAT